MMTHEEITLSLAAHALDALEPDEARSVEEHVSICAECCEELWSFRDTAGELVCLFPPMEPPPELRARILRSIGLESL